MCLDFTYTYGRSLPTELGCYVCGAIIFARSHKGMGAAKVKAAILGLEVRVCLLLGFSGADSIQKPLCLPRSDSLGEK